MIGMRLVDDPAREAVVSIKDAGVRRRFYRRTRPDGTPIDDVEWALGLIEGPAGAILREVERRWPLSFDDKRVLGEFFALQVLRSPRWCQGYEVRSRRLLSEYRASGLFAEEIAESGRSADEVFSQTRDLGRPRPART